MTRARDTQANRARARGAVRAALLLALAASAARAGGPVSSDDAAWPALLDALATGRAADPLGGVQSLPSEGVAALIAATQVPVAAAPRAPPAVGSFDGAWLTPLTLATLRAGAAAVEARPYSTPVHPRDLTGAVDLSCEHQQGRPCGDGAGAMLELDSAAGVGSWLSLATRVRAVAGSNGYAPSLDLDRAVLHLAWGPLSFQLGRDVLALGPAVRSSTAVSDHAAPQDGLRLQLSPVALPFAPFLRFSFLYFLDRLRDPQTFSGTLVDCTRLQLDLFDRFQVGASRLLQLGGDGAPDYGGFLGFLHEHFGRHGSGLEENNRLEADFALRVPALWGARFYYELAYEDTRSPVINSFIHDPDHLIGVELRAIPLGPLRRFFLELEKTSWLSQEHGTFKTGMTNAGRTLGTPLGPDTVSLWLRADLGVGALGHAAQLSPWAEWLRASSDYWTDTQEAGVFLVSRGVYEHRQRLGVDLSLAPGPGWTLTAGVFAERVGNDAFVTGVTRFNGGARVALSLRPGWGAQDVGATE